LPPDSVWHIFLTMRPPRFSPAILRLQARPDEPGTIVPSPRSAGSRRPHPDATVAAVRRLVEGTALNYAEIAARTGVARASICRWRDQGWKRHLFAPRATDTVRTERASARLRARTLAARLHALAERYVRELEATPGVDLVKLGEALELMKLAKLAAKPKRRKPRNDMNHPSALAGKGDATPMIHPSPLAGEGDATPRAEGERLVASGGGYAELVVSDDPDAPPIGKRKAAELAAEAEWLSSEAERETARETLREELRTAGVNLDRAPRAAVEDFIESRTPPKLLPRDDPALRPRGHRSRRNREHAWLLGRDK
jgi:transposase-like protein